MTHFLTLDEVLRIHERVIDVSGGAFGVRDLGGVQAAVVSPQMTFDGEELYPSLAEKAAALAYSLVNNHPFLDGNKRVAHAAMETFLLLHGYELRANVEAQERLFLSLAAGEVSREEFTRWVSEHAVQRGGA